MPAIRSEEDPSYAVLTGDIVHSSGLAPETRNRLPDLLRELGRAAQKAWPKALPANISIFRGDSWQVLVAPERALRAALFIRAGVIAAGEDEPLDTRIALAIGPVDFVPQRITEGDGPAYRASGKALDELREPFRLSLQGGPSMSKTAFPIVAPLLDTICQGWTARQAQAVQARLRNWPQLKISENFKPEPITQQSVARHLEKAHWEAVDRALIGLESDWLPALKSQ